MKLNSKEDKVLKKLETIIEHWVSSAEQQMYVQDARRMERATGFAMVLASYLMLRSQKYMNRLTLGIVVANILLVIINAILLMRYTLPLFSLSF